MLFWWQLDKTTILQDYTDLIHYLLVQNNSMLVFFPINQRVSYETKPSVATMTSAHPTAPGMSLLSQANVPISQCQRQGCCQRMSEGTVLKADGLHFQDTVSKMQIWAQLLLCGVDFCRNGNTPLCLQLFFPQHIIYEFDQNDLFLKHVCFFKMLSF